MSGVAVLKAVLHAAPSVTAVVPVARIMGGYLPLGTEMPAIGITQISGLQRTTVSMTGAKKLQIERIQVALKAKTYVAQKQLLGLVRAACTNRNGTVGGVDLDSMLPDGEGPDLYEQDEAIFTQSLDFIVKWRL